MSETVARESEAGLGVGAVELLVEVLSQSARGNTPPNHAPPTGATPTGFYDRLCEAICRLAQMRRAVIFQYDAGSRRVRAVGAHGLSLAPFASAQLSVESAPFTARALATDTVVELAGDLRGQASEEFAELISEPAQLVCAPMTAAGRGLGVILADRPMTDPPLREADRGLLWTLGKVAGLVSVARTVATQSERAKALEQRIDLAREIHEGVIQRLFGVSMALDGDGDLPAAARERCAAETQAALAELRSALQRPLGRAPRATQTTLVAEIERLARLHPAIGLALDRSDDGAQVPAALEPLAQSVLREAVRNVVKHAEPTHVSVRVGHAGGAFSMEIVNDGVDPAARRRAGMGLRLATVEALQLGGFVEFGEREGGRGRLWQVRLIVPDSDDDE
ncbi:MAG TPA: GAF domain-containing protein [Solirubrobacteraceae bacterium]|nr:GAF domain-containing protein [Solirubrobacteraceae bacterium]